MTVPAWSGTGTVVGRSWNASTTTISKASTAAPTRTGQRASALRTPAHLSGAGEDVGAIAGVDTGAGGGGAVAAGAASQADITPPASSALISPQRVQPSI